MKIIIDILTTIFCILTISAVGTNEVYLVLSVLTTLAIIFSNNRNQILVIKNKILFILILFLLFVTLEILICGKNELYYVLNLFNMFFPIILYCYYKKRDNFDRLINIIFIIWIIIAIRACYLYSSGQLSARYVISHVQEDIPFSGGGYGFAIGSAILASFLFDVCLWKKSNKKILLIILIALLFYVVLLTKSTTTLIALIIGFISSIIFRILSISTFSSLSKKQLLGLVVLILISFFIIYYKSAIGNYIISLFNNNNDILSRRIKEFGAIISGNNIYDIDTSDSLNRIDRIFNTIELFFKYPFFGTVSVVGINHYTQVSFGLGGHAELFDAFAKFGIIAGIPYLLLFVTGIKEILNCKKCDLGFGFIITFLILFLFNPCLYIQVNIVLFLLLPLLSKKILKGDNCV